ncbi:hypothetical protein B0H13DRAFT_891707 [Mycena leptocephala]|nr:hypothetical protein B0H13DRAFT_891707 [Mycena leptocephala]
MKLHLQQFLFKRRIFFGAHTLRKLRTGPLNAVPYPPLQSRGAFFSWSPVILCCTGICGPRLHYLKHKLGNFCLHFLVQAVSCKSIKIPRFDHLITPKTGPEAKRGIDLLNFDPLSSIVQISVEQNTVILMVSKSNSEWPGVVPPLDLCRRMSKERLNEQFSWRIDS